MPFQVHQTIPILRIFDAEKAKAFYLGFLGFEVNWEHRFEETLPLYCEISRAGCVLHLSEHHGDACPGSALFLRVSGLDEFHAEITSKGYRYMRPGIQESFHNSRQVRVTDPFGNRLTFDEAKPEAAEAPDKAV